MLIRRGPNIKSSEITPERLYVTRRDFIGATAAGALAVSMPGALIPRGRGPGQDELTPFQDVTTYNNFYEFGLGKDDPSRNAHQLTTRPWTVVVQGECEKPGEWALDDMLRGITVEERIYRLRCVEAWSMVIPWHGFSMSELFRKFEPTPKANYVEFTTVLRPQEMPGQRRAVLEWPYVEGLRMDEAMHPLAIFATGLYDRPLPKQNGAPFRIVVPWKYGFKSIKSIVRIRFSENQPRNSWNIATPHEYGFYANVNPLVDHPRWTQKSERRIGEFRRRETLMFNGYADQVGHLYAGMDLRRYY
jgi:methionine sulfoxide reductase catalytic subunit